MPSSNVPGWIALASFALACLLVRAQFREEGDDPGIDLLMESMTALVAGSTLGSLPRLFGLENEGLRWGILGVSAIFGVVGWILLIRAAKKLPAGESHS